MKSSHVFFRLVVALNVFAWTSSLTPVRAQVPSMIHYQGRVSVSGVPFTGSGQFKFALIRTDTGASTWSNDGTSTAGSQPTAAVSLSVASGLYAVNLGDTNIANMTGSIPASALSAAEVVLRIWFNDGSHGFQALGPDVRLTSVPYSLVAASVPNGSITAAQLGAGTVSGSVVGCNVGANLAEVYIRGMNVYCGVGAGTPTGGFAYTLVNVPAGSHTLVARLPDGTVLSQPVVVTQGGSLSGVNFNFGCGACGDGIVQTDRGEACDDGNVAAGDGCSAACQVEVAVCGNGIREAGEECDDGGTTGGDGCSSACKVEAVNETESNNSMGTASPSITVGPGTPVRVVGGKIFPVGDQDYIQMTVTAGTTVHIEVFDGSGLDCSGGMTTALSVLDSGAGEIVADDSSGINGCSALSFYFDAGTYYIVVSEFGNDATISDYRLKVTSTASVGSESEPNEQRSSANQVVGRQVVVAGDHTSSFDEDWYRVTLYGTSSLRLEIVEGDTLERCEDGTIDSLIEVYNSAGALLVRDDDSGREFCSMADGTGSTPAFPELHNLPAGVYYIHVSASPNASTDGSQFNYRLVVDIR